MSTNSLKILILALIVTFVSFAKGFKSVPRAAAKRNYKFAATESAESGYGPLGSLTRQGPVPFFIRLAKPDTYDAAVTKYMLQEKCSRLEAMANM